MKKAIHRISILLRLSILLLFTFIQSITNAQTFSVSFPIGLTIYKGNNIPLKVVIEGISCANTQIKSHTGELTMFEPCQYTYRCKTAGLDTIEVYVGKGKNIKKIGEQIIIVKERPLPEATVGGLKGGTIKKGMLKAQAGVGAQFYISGNHWEYCTVESFNFIAIRNNKVVIDLHIEGNLFNNEIKTAIETLEQGDKVMIANITGCSLQGGGNLKSLEFVIE